MHLLIGGFKVVLRLQGDPEGGVAENWAIVGNCQWHGNGVAFLYIRFSTYLMAAVLHEQGNEELRHQLFARQEVIT